ncbi:hypothetical protein [Cellulosimicrobium arenosum]|uniref:Uncharacterized protein n=1 Tax=Cellulosimicrobium arenosum TaxID=2708133 RepID=A0A927G8J4_9MICO|nr:hypothetical protein [Cellulosimicrobium arenosum]MBD8078678.1 hypothetical protein [Cellulosimicrobium arenosum]
MNGRPLPTVVGPTENALRALLVRTLRDTEIRGYDEWVVLSMTAGGAPPHAVVRALGAPDAHVSAVADALARRGLLADRTTLTARGHDVLDAARALVGHATAPLSAGIAPEHVQITTQVLDTLRTRAEHAVAHERGPGTVAVPGPRDGVRPKGFEPPTF